MANANCLNVEKVIANSEGESYLVSKLDLSGNPELLIDRKVVSSDELRRLTDDSSMIHGNFFLAEGQSLRQIRVVPYDDIDFDSLPKQDPWTVAGIFRALAATETHLVFQPEYYRQLESGISFEKFVPDFSQVFFNAKHILVGNTKFNIALVAVVNGYLAFEESRTNAVRHCHFKIVKGGELVYDKIMVYERESNKYFLSKVGTKVGDGVYEINLAKYPVFDDTRPYITSRIILHMIDSINAVKSKLKAQRYYISKLKEKMRDHFLMYEEREWYYGEPLEEDYVSDLGADTLRGYRKRNSQSPTIEGILTSLGDFGQKLTTIFNGVLDISSYDPASMKTYFDNISSTVISNFKSGILKQAEALQLLSLFDAYDIGGTHVERYRSGVEAINKSSTELNILNLKLLSLRRDAFETFDVPDRLGLVESAGKNECSIYSTHGAILTLVKGKVEPRHSRAVRISEDHKTEDDKHE